MNLSFFKNKKILVTGHTGFKGSWLCEVLIEAGAEVTGYALAPNTAPDLFTLSGIEKQMNSVIGDIRDLENLKSLFQQIRPEFVLHLAAQPIVRESYQNPVYTYETNVMGTVNIMECIRTSDSVRSFLNVTTDKVYGNKEWIWGYREDEQLDGFDPYSNSKSCSELVTASYRRSFFEDNHVAISTARAGNVIGGGDFSQDRIIPDCVRAAIRNQEIVIRNPHSVRPYQHVLEPIFAYLLILKTQYEQVQLSDCYNVGPDECDCITTGELVDIFCDKWGAGACYINRCEDGPHEANFLKLDCSKLKSALGWRARWNVETAVEKTVEWSRTYLQREDISACMRKQILDFIALCNEDGMF